MSENEEYRLTNAYHSENSEEEEITQPKERIARKNRKWIYKSNFESVDEAKVWLVQDGYWSLYKSHETDAGRKEDYRCNKIPFRSKNQCANALQMLYHAEDLGVTIFESGEDHDHDELLLNIKQHGINKETKDFINQLLKNKVASSKTILDLLANEAKTNQSIKMPKNQRQLYNYIAGLRHKSNLSTAFLLKIKVFLKKY